MNPNLPVGGSAFDIAEATGAETTGMVVAGLDYGFTHFGSHYRGSSSIDPVRTETIGAHLFNLSGEYHLDAGLTAGARLPFGTIHVDPVAADASSVTGLGDLELGASYDLARVWGMGGYRPSVRIRPTLSLPTGETRRVIDGDAPPNIISLGTGTVAAGLEIQASQYLSRSWAARVRLGGRAPLGESDEDVRIGASVSGGAGALLRIRDKLLVSLDASLRYRRPSRERAQGEIVNSGGSWLGAQLAASYPVRDDLIVGARASLPLYTDVNGEQISQTVGVGGFVALTFGGGGDDKDEHDHGDDHDHDHGHDHGDDGGDVAALARGGESFSLASARVQGKVVVIDFWADWCHPCEAITALLERRAARDSGLAVRKVEVPTFESPVATEHLAGVAGLPVVWILDRNGRVARKLVQVTPDQLDRALDEIVARSAGD